MRIILSIALLGLLSSACNDQKDTGTNTIQQPAEAVFDMKDYHTLSNADVLTANHLNLDIAVDFEQKVVSGSATWDLTYVDSTARLISFDTRDLIIDSVTDARGNKLEFNLNGTDSILGQALQVTLPTSLAQVKIFYKTTQKATALQWLLPSQTFGKKQPFLYTQSESIHARSWIPVQDGPGIRYTYNAQVKVPKGLMALMSAQNPTAVSEDGIYKFNMDIPIPAYLMALAVGDISFKSIDGRTGVYAEPSVLPKAYKEFEDVGKMVGVAENLYGPYRWGRYDILVLPSGFPIGGMENPKLTFCTPTILAGDKSLVNLIAHELAHNWSGNLVTNSTWNDFWLNEGFTIYFERRITEAMNGKDYTDMLWEIGYQDLTATVSDLGAESEDTHLRLNLKGRNPDEGLTDIPYEKGGYLLKLIEQTVGRAKIDTFLKNYFADHAFQTMNTNDFVTYLNKNLLDANPEWKAAININEWLNAPGIPKSCPRVNSARFESVAKTATAFKADGNTKQIQAKAWSTAEWMHFLRLLRNAHIGTEKMKALDDAFSLTKTQNSEKADLWYLLAIENNYETAYPAMRAFLAVTGREKFLQPVYKALMQTESGKEMAKEIYKVSRENYHPLTQKLIDEIVSP